MKETKSSYRQLIYCACFNLRKTTRAVTQYYDRILQPVGLRSTQFTVLAILKTKSGIPLTKLAEMLVMDRTTLSRNLGPLEREGLIDIRPGEDRRQRIALMTQTGEKVLEKAVPYWRQAQKQIVEKLGKESFHALLEKLGTITGKIGAK